MGVRARLNSANSVKEWSSVGLGCVLVRREWQVQGSFEARGLTRQLCRAFPNFGASMMTIRNAWRASSHIEFRAFLSFFLFFLNE